MKRRISIVLGICLISFNLVACSNRDKTQTSDEVVNGETISSQLNREEYLFDEDVVVVDNDIAQVVIRGKEKVVPGDSIGYSFLISNKSNEKIGFYVKDVTVDGKEHKTSLDKDLKMTLEPNTDFSTQITVSDIDSLDKLKNTKGIFSIEINEGVKDYNFELE